MMKQMCDYLYLNGYKLLLKAHPCDLFYPSKIDELHCELLNIPGLSMESLCGYAKPQAVVSFASTTLINPYVFWKIPTFCLTDMLDRTKMKSYLDEIDSFKRTYKNFVHFVQKHSCFSI